MKKAISIHIGGLHASRGSAIIETTLGSCVAVCLYDPLEQIGGMNHILLPGKADLLHFYSAARYFHTDTGDVFLKRISSSFYSKIDQRERKMMNKIQKQVQKPTNITLF